MKKEGLEENLKKRTRKADVQRAVLDAVAVVGVLGVTLVAPNTLSLLGRTLDKYSARNVRSVSKRLVEKGLLRVGTKGPYTFYTITETGRVFLNKSRAYRVAIPKRWDGKWRIVTFDIAEPRRQHRTLLRQTLHEIGFERLQDSVWVFPYDCEELITLLKADYGLGKEVLYIIADSIENDRALRGRFKLS